MKLKFSVENPKNIDEKINNLLEYIEYLKSIKSKYQKNTTSLVNYQKQKLDKLLKLKNKCL